MDIRKTPYSAAYEARQQLLEESIRTEHRHGHESEDPEVQIKPSKGSQQLGEGAQE